MKLYIIRHGNTYCNEKKLYCGREDVSLSEGGILNLRDLKEKFYYPLSEVYFTSGAKRANETLKIFGNMILVILNLNLMKSLEEMINI